MNFNEFWNVSYRMWVLGNFDLNNLGSEMSHFRPIIFDPYRK